MRRFAVVLLGASLVLAVAISASASQRHGNATPVQKAEKCIRAALRQENLAIGDLRDLLVGHVSEEAVATSTGRTLVRINPRYYRPAEVDLLIGCADKARDTLGWAPQTSLEELCAMMVETDLRRNKMGATF